MTFEEFIHKHSLQFQIYELKFRQGKKHSEIGSTLNKRTAYIGDKYRLFTWALFRCYCNHLKSIGIKINAQDIMDFYQNAAYCCAYLENEYSEELNLFRGSEPPLFFNIIKNYLPYRELSDKEALYLEEKVITARNIYDETFSDIGKQLRLTQRKAQEIYCHYYHKKVMKAIRIIEPNVDFDFSKYVYDSSVSSYKQWELIASEYPDMVQGLMD